MSVFILTVLSRMSPALLPAKLSPYSVDYMDDMKTFLISLDYREKLISHEHGALICSYTTAL